MHSCKAACWKSLLGAEVSERRALDVREDGVLEEAGSLDLVLTDALDLSFSNAQTLQQRRDLALFVQKGLSVGGAQN